MPLLVFVLLALVCLALLGFACACLSDEPALAFQAPALTATTDLWPVIALAALAATLLLRAAPAARGRASPELLQRFLF